MLDSVELSLIQNSSLQWSQEKRRMYQSDQSNIWKRYITNTKKYEINMKIALSLGSAMEIPCVIAFFVNQYNKVVY